MRRRSIRSEVRRRLPRILINVIVAFLFWIISQIGPLFVKGIIIPGINLPPPFNTVSSIIGLTATLVMILFLIRAVSDILFFTDVSTEIFLKTLGIKEKRPLKRAARDITYIILTLLLVTAASPILSSIPQVGGYLNAILSFSALGIFLILIYDIGRVIHEVLSEKTRRMADRISNHIEERRNRRGRNEHNSN
ncbi:hypothetical protein DRO37_09690 [Candidatus Bathyarchaeota archaeon]|nr:MAG: hypothetical protein DRO37_09690 [Candidatus Bathyarchaeota archaeon]